ncbi:uncharacterized protein LOC107031562 [Solanum pennellii]|uniref:Uncharacterized protein LOC107031562 n=1 Tax=Solanum pennellii TaxID=28526 RepID=A0ABM1UVP6_SOLPN|nr:uncharacterized protein LOC107031562 [Solanum pennellii]
MNKCNNSHNFLVIQHHNHCMNQCSNVHKIQPISKEITNLRNKVVHGQTKRKLILLNELNYPNRPTKEVVSELGSFLGTLARNGTFCPINVFNWKKLKTHDDLQNYNKEKYDIPDVGKEWALGAIQLAWRGYNCRLNKTHFYAYADNATQMAKRRRPTPINRIE